MSNQPESNLFSKISSLTVWIVIVLTAIGALVLFYLGDYFEGWVGLASLVVFILFQLVFPRAAGMSNPAVMRMILSAIMVSSQTVGRYFYLYRRIQHFDKLQHVFYGIVIALVGLVILYRLIPSASRRQPQLHTAAIGFFMTGTAMNVLFIWEVFEYACDRLFGSDMQDWKSGHLSGLSDTMLDMIFGLAGALIASATVMLVYRCSRSKFYDRYMAGFFSELKPETSKRLHSNTSEVVQE